MSGEENVQSRKRERRRAAEYLDLWERHVTLTALHSKCPQMPETDSDS